MAGFMKNAMSYLGMSDVADADDDFDEDEPETPAAAPSSFDADHSVTPAGTQTAPAAAAPAREASPFAGRVSRITTIHPRTYEDAQMVGRAIRDGVPVVLNLTGVPEAVAYRIVDFSAGVVFGVRGSIERVTPRVFLLSPAQVNIKVEEPVSGDNAHDLFAD